MKCCTDCFKDERARELAKGLAIDDPGTCGLCGNKSELRLVVSDESELAEHFSDLLSIFSPSNGEDDCCPSLYEAFFGTWSILEEVPKTSFDKMIRAMFPEDNRVAKLLSGEVRFDPSPDPEDWYSLSFFGDKDWTEFSRELKNVHRYHANIANKDVLNRVFNALSKEITSSDGSWYRARRWNEMPLEKLSKDELKEAPESKAGEGRMSPRGVKCLYISSSLHGAMSEIRASRHDDIAVMEMLPTRSLKILDLSRIAAISPFDENVDCRELASNLKNLIQIKEALVKPMRSTDDEIEYVPTQYIADYARSIGFDGIGYESVLHESDETPSYNIASFALFDDAFRCQDIRLYRVDSVELGITQKTSVVDVTIRP